MYGLYSRAAYGGARTVLKDGDDDEDVEEFQ